MEEPAKYNTKSSNKIEDLTDRELQEAILKAVREAKSNTNGINTWVQIWSWLVAIGLVVQVFIYFANNI